MLVVEIGSVITTVVTFINIIEGRGYSLALQVSAWLWATVLFANFAEAMAEGRITERQLRSEAQAQLVNLFFPAEVLNRVNHIVVFRDLQVDQYVAIAQLHLARLVEEQRERHEPRTVTVGPGVAEFVGRQAFERVSQQKEEAKRRGREVNNVISDLITSPYTGLLLPTGGKVRHIQIELGAAGGIELRVVE